MAEWRASQPRTASWRHRRGRCAAARLRRVSDPRGYRAERCSALLGLPEDPVDLSDLVEQLLADSDVGGLLGFAGGLGGCPEQAVKLGVLREMVGLEVVRPEHPEVVLDEVGALFFDRDGPRLEDLVIRGVELFHDGFD